MIKLYQFTPAFGLPNASPFCMKVETLGSSGLSAKTARASIFAAGSLLPAHEGALLFFNTTTSSCVEMVRGLRRSLCV
jgi:hypothetical protein